MGLQFTSVGKCNSATVCIVVNGSPLQPVKDDKEDNKVNEAIGADEHSMQVW